MGLEAIHCYYIAPLMHALQHRATNACTTKFALLIQALPYCATQAYVTLSRYKWIHYYIGSTTISRCMQYSSALLMHASLDRVTQECVTISCFFYMHYARATQGCFTISRYLCMHYYTALQLHALLYGAGTASVHHCSNNDLTRSRKPTSKNIFQCVVSVTCHLKTSNYD